MPRPQTATHESVLCILATRASAEAALAKHQLNQAKAKTRLLQQEKRNIYDQISAADELKKQQQVCATSASSLRTKLSSGVNAPTIGRVPFSLISCCA